MKIIKFKRMCEICKVDLFYSNKSNYNRAIKENSICNNCSSKYKRKGIKRSEYQKRKISEATKLAMNNPDIIQKIIIGMNKPEVKQKMSENGKKQMDNLLKTEDDKFLWSKKISNGTKQKWLLRPEKEKQQIKNQISQGRKSFFNKMLDPIYKQNHIKKCLCNGNVKDTKPEKEIRMLLKSNNIKFIKQFQIKDKVYDFYIPEKNLLIEVDGVYWHGKGLLNNQMNDMQIKHKKNDIFKNDLAKKEGYNLLRIWEDETKNFDIEKEIINYGK